MASRCRSYGAHARFEWDVFLSTEHQLKMDLRKQDSIGPEKRLHLLKFCFPRFVWRAIAYSGPERKIEVIFDATDFDRGKYFLGELCYDPELEKSLELVTSKS